MIVLLRAQQQNTKRKDAPLFAYSPVAYAMQSHPTPERALGEILPVESGHFASPIRLEQSATPVNWHCSTVWCTEEMGSNSITSSPIFVPFGECWGVDEQFLILGTANVNDPYSGCSREQAPYLAPLLHFRASYTI